MKKKEKKRDKNKIFVIVIAGILAAAMILSVAATLIYTIFAK